jgi:predicted PurR-regulated permease PerM
MAASRKSSTLADPFKLTMLIFAVIAFMYFTGEVLKPLALSVLLCFALAPAVRMLERVGLPRAVAASLTVVIALTLLAGVGYIVGRQLTSLANRLPDYQGNIENKIRGVLKPEERSATDKLRDMAAEVTAKMEKPPASGPDQPIPIQKVEVVSQPSFQERLRSSSGPYLEFLGVSSFVLILVLFMLIGRKDLSDRIIVLFGHRQVSLTTRTMEEIGQRISRYLATFAMVNSGFGLVIGLGLGLIGVPFAILWGCMAAMLRFIPYVGPAVAFVLPLVFSFAQFPGWMQPLEVVALFAVVEVVLNSFLEPIIYGKTTGISALGLLVAAMFWTWLWGTMGLLLSTPMTVCLAVLGKYVPSLRFFATLLGEEAELDPDVRLYQRLVALDHAGAIEVVEGMLKKLPRVDVFDQVLVPALARAERDAERDELDEAEREFAWRVIGDVLDGLEGVPDLSLASAASALDAGARSDDSDTTVSPVTLVGLAVQDTSDALVLRMLGQILVPAGLSLEIVTDTESSLQVAERVAEHSPRLVIVSHLPPEGLTLARYLVRRLRSQFADLPIIVGRWGETGGAAVAAERLSVIGATDVIFTLSDARDRILKALPSRLEGTVAPAPTALSMEPIHA